MVKTKHTPDLKVNENWKYLESRWRREDEDKPGELLLAEHKKRERD